MGSLASQKIADTYDSLLKLTADTSGLTGTAQVVEDGVGVDSALCLATDKVKVLPTTTDTVDAFKVVDRDAGQALLSIHTTGGTKGVVINEDSEADVDFRVEGAAQDYLLFVNADTDKIGIGEDAPDQLLHLKGANAQICIEEDANEFIRIGVDKTAAGVSTIGWADAQELRLGIYTSVTDTGLEAWMTIKADGKVGIGTLVPSQKLHILGDAGTYPAIALCRNETDTAVGTPDNEILGQYVFQGLDASEATGVKPGASVVARANGAWDTNVNDAPSDLEFFTQSDGSGNGMAAPRMVINKDGDVGIGNTNPGKRLHVEEAADGDVVAMFENSHATGDGISIKLGATSISTSEFFIFFLDLAGNVEGSISGGGSDPDITLNDPSDRRLKENIVDIPDAMSIISEIKPRTFKWKNRGSDTSPRYGFIADEWFDVFPDSVIGKRDADGKLITDAMTTNDEGEEVIDRQMISTKVVIPVLVKAIQELSAKVEVLENNNQTGDDSNGESDEDSSSGESSSESSGEDSGGAEGSSSDSSESSESSSGDDSESSGGSGSDSSDDSEGGSGGDDSSGE